MILPTIEVVKCSCGHSHCSKHGFQFGTFYQGCGWDKEAAEEIAMRCNVHTELVDVMTELVKDFGGISGGTDSLDKAEELLGRVGK